MVHGPLASLPDLTCQQNSGISINDSGVVSTAASTDGGEVSCFGLANAWKHRNSKLQTSQRLTCGLSSATDGSNNNEDDDSCSQQLARAETAKTANTSESIRKLVCGGTNYRDPPWRCSYILTVMLASPRLVSVQRHVATAPFLLPTRDGSRRGRLPFE